MGSNRAGTMGTLAGLPGWWKEQGTLTGANRPRYPSVWPNTHSVSKAWIMASAALGREDVLQGMRGKE